MNTTFDLFAEPAPAVPDLDPHMDGMLLLPVAKRAPDPERGVYQMEPCGLNRWLYRDEIVTYDDRKAALAWRGRWATIEGIGQPEIRGDSHVEVCKAIDTRQGAAA